MRTLPFSQSVEGAREREAQACERRLADCTRTIGLVSPGSFAELALLIEVETLRARIDELAAESICVEVGV